jgi:enoyl-[acyl-carrier-protein] reductase (NADH)
VINDYRGKAVIVTGGSAGIGLGTGLTFGQAGAHVYLTYKWGSQDEDEVRQRFAEVGATEPTLVQADVSSDEDTRTLLQTIQADHDHIEAFVSNVAFAPTVNELNDLNKRGLFKGIEYSAWPIVAYLQSIKSIFGTYPRYVVGISSAGPDHYYPRYDMVAVAKSVMEVLSRYLAARLVDEDCRVNALRVGVVRTRALEATFGPEFADFCQKYAGERFFIEPAEVGKAVFALCSGLMDALSGQVLMLDRGTTFSDNLSYLYAHRQENGLGNA